MSKFLPPGLGWQPDLPDLRDYTACHPFIQALLQTLKRPRGGRVARPARVDWREYFPPVEDQLQLNSSPAHACLALLQYFERRALGKIIEPSRLFLHQTTRQLLHHTGNSGTDIRTTLKAMIRFGTPPEQQWPYEIDNLDEQPSPFLYSFTQEMQGLHYFRLGSRDSTGEETLEIVKSFLAAGFPSVFGFPVYSSLTAEADVPFPTVYDVLRGGQAVVAVGYDDARRIRSTRGALLIRNSWGTGWGDGGFGWLPGDYVKEELGRDFWGFTKGAWVESGEFKESR